MKTNIFILVIPILMLIFSACGSEANELHNCSFEQVDENKDGLIDETEQSLLDQCNLDLLTTKSEIENNLIGEWELIGYGDGWSSTISKPCCYMKFTTDKLIIEFENANKNFTSENEWEINEEESIFGQKINKITFTPALSENIGISIFCESYMYGNATARDGNMYLFEKVK